MMPAILSIKQSCPNKFLITFSSKKNICLMVLRHNDLDLRKYLIISKAAKIMIKGAASVFLRHLHFTIHLQKTNKQTQKSKQKLYNQ